MITLTVGISNFSTTDSITLWDGLLATAVDADEAGVDRLVVVDHVVMGNDLSAYDGGRFPTGPDGIWLEPLTVLSALATATSRVRLSTGILIAPLRRPAVLAKMLSTLDVISNGRIDLGVGVGWQAIEYEAAGLAFQDRGRLLDETLTSLKALWTSAPCTLPAAPHHGVAEVEEVWSCPTPVQPGGIPIWISGRLNPAVLRRITQFGNGWIPWGLPLSALPPAIAQIRDSLHGVERTMDHFQVRAGLPAVRTSSGEFDWNAIFVPIPDLFAAGVTDFGVHLPIPEERSERQEVFTAMVEQFSSVAATLQ